MLLPRPRRVERLGREVPWSEPVVSLDPVLREQSYRLVVADDAISLTAADEAGLFYGRATLAQLRSGDGSVSSVAVEDHPDVPVRSVMLDVSRTKVPTLDTLKSLVDRLASWKVNGLQLYTEHTFAYEGHEVVWQYSDPYTCEEMRELDRWCRARHVELVANQNCLGHMERWLRHERYRPLAVSEHGFVDPFGRVHPASTLDPADPRSIELVGDLLTQLLPCFTSPRVHVGLDEPYGLPDRGLDDYLSHLRKLRDLDQLEGREMLVWGEVLYHHPELMGRVPEGVTPCVWGYEAGFAFQEYADRLRDSGLPYWICPGTSTWLSLAGRAPNAIDNIREAAAVSGADGFMVCDWGDYGHLQYPPASEPAFATAAALSWCEEANRNLDLAAVLSAHAFADPSGRLAAAVLALGSLYLSVEPYVPNMSAISLPLYYPEITLGKTYEGRFGTPGLSRDDLERAEAVATDAVRLADAADSTRPDGELVAAEVAATGRLLAHLCRDSRARLAGDGTLRSVPDPIRGELAHELDQAIIRHRRLWLQRNRPGGLAESAGWLETLLAAYRDPPPPV